ncbi:Na/Pi cotransporter family protein [Desulfothermobacter acidiphilus]|uniref:Na/Pi cotransporter family protein n=1 Tax=Desulfothermobacter acidiphilus TaxID=1938353 RepID=UPI003F899F76
MIEGIAGLVLLLGGLKLLQEGLTRLGGGCSQALLARVLAGPWRSFAGGTVAAALTQSSTVVSVFTISLVHSHLLPLPEAIGVILGANLGTCLTVQLMAWHPENLACFLGTVGALLACLRPPWRYLGLGLLGLSLLFVGITCLEAGCQAMRTPAFLFPSPPNGEPNQFLVFLAATLTTAMVHSSSLTTGLSMALYAQGVISRQTALVQVLGNNLGTCFTALLVSLASSSAGRRVAVAHFLVNLAGALLFFPLLGPWGELSERLSSGAAHEIANAHTLYNLATGLIFLPFAHPLARFLEKILP